VSGPYSTSTEALADAEQLLQAVRAVDPGGPMIPAIRTARRQAAVDYVTGVLAAAGVELGAYDQRIAAWLAIWDADTVRVVLGWVERAHAAATCLCGCPAAGPCECRGACACALGCPYCRAIACTDQGGGAS